MMCAADRQSFPLPVLTTGPWLVSVLLLAVLMSGCDELLGPRSFDDCILKNMRGVSSNSAAAQIRRSCREKFPEGAEVKGKSHELKPWETTAITGRAGLNYGNRYGGNLYNGNKDITVTQVRIQVTTKADGNEVTRIYTADVTIPPLTTKDFAFDIVAGDQGADYSWGIAGAMGF